MVFVKHRVLKAIIVLAPSALIFWSCVAHHRGCRCNGGSFGFNFQYSFNLMTKRGNDCDCSQRINYGNTSKKHRKPYRNFFIFYFQKCHEKQRNYWNICEHKWSNCLKLNTLASFLINRFLTWMIKVLCSFPFNIFDFEKFSRCRRRVCLILLLKYITNV